MNDIEMLFNKITNLSEMLINVEYEERSSVSDQIISMCKKAHLPYESPEYIDYNKKKINKTKRNAYCFKRTNNIFENMVEVAISLSNLCNYAILHKKCPANCVVEKQIMPSKLVYKILDELAKAKYDGIIVFHLYNEPLIDPRLFKFIDYIQNNLESACVEIYSNGYYLEQVMVDELLESGVSAIVCTAYTEKEFDRLTELNVRCAYRVLWGELDDRLDRYEKNDNIVLEQSICRTFFSQVPIFPNGDIGICCMDYKHEYNLGNVNNMSLEECLNSDKVRDIQKRLLAGDRSVLPLCSHCSWTGQ